MNLNELRQKRAKLIRDARALHEAAEARGQEMSAEDSEQFDRLMAQADDIRQQIERIERLTVAETGLNDPADGERGQRDDEDIHGEERQQMPAFESRGLRGLSETDLRGPEWSQLLNTLSPDYRQAFNAWLRLGQESRALQADLNTVGGYLVTPMQMADRLIRAIDDMTYIRQWATVFSVATADALGAPSLDNDPADPTWTSELAIGSEDSTMSFGRRELRPHPLAKYIKVSKTLLRKVPSVESLAIERLSYKFGTVMENNYLNGNGAQKPLGLFVASNEGIPTSRDVSTDNTTTAMTFNGLINAKYTLKQQYWRNARWMFHRDGVKQLVKIVDGEGQYIWRESVRAGEPDRLLNLPVFMSEFAPNTFTASQYVGMVGDFSHYWIVDALSITFERLVELFAATNQIALVGRVESDGQPVLAEAFARVQLAAG